MSRQELLASCSCWGLGKFQKKLVDKPHLEPLTFQLEVAVPEQNFSGSVDILKPDSSWWQLTVLSMVRSLAIGVCSNYEKLITLHLTVPYFSEDNQNYLWTLPNIPHEVEFFPSTLSETFSLEFEQKAWRQEGSYHKEVISASSAFLNWSYRCPLCRHKGSGRWPHSSALLLWVPHGCCLSST